MGDFYTHDLQGIDGEPLDLESWRGHVVLAVNVASRCGLTPQYDGLETLYREGRDAGLIVLGMPCNQFGQQEPGSEAEIKSFCSLSYDVSFPMSSKLDVNGANRHPLYTWLAGPGAAHPGDIQWNFEKFLIGRDGQVRARFAPDVTPEDAGLRAAVAEALG